MSNKHETAAETLRRIIDEPAKVWDFSDDAEKWAWIAKQYKALNDAKEKKESDLSK